MLTLDMEFFLNENVETCLIFRFEIPTTLVYINIIYNIECNFGYNIKINIPQIVCSNNYCNSAAMNSKLYILFSDECDPTKTTNCGKFYFYFTDINTVVDSR